MLPSPCSFPPFPKMDPHSTESFPAVTLLPVIVYFRIPCKTVCMFPPNPSDFLPLIWKMQAHRETLTILQASQLMWPKLYRPRWYPAAWSYCAWEINCSFCERQAPNYSDKWALQFMHSRVCSQLPDGSTIK